MGNDILSSDMIVGGIVRSSYNCFQFKDYVEGCQMLYDLNSFLQGFGLGVDDMPEPKNISLGIRDRLDPSNDYRNYRLKYAPLVMKALGMYNREMINAVKNKQYPMQSFST